MAESPHSALEARLAAASTPPVDAFARIAALVELAWALRNDDVERAHALAREARELAIHHGDKLSQARAARTLAMTIHGGDAMPAVLAFAEEAKRLFDEVGDATGRAASRDFLASIYEYLGQTAVALELAVDALAIARALGDPIRLGYALSNVGGILAGSTDVDAGVERLKEALDIFETAKHLDGVATISGRLCKVLKQAGRIEEALKYAELCRQVAVQNGNEWALGLSLTVVAEIEDDRGRAAEAERLTRAALDGMKTEAVRNLLGATVQVSLARLLMRRGALEEADRELGDALRRIEGNSVSIVAESDAHEALAESRERQGDLAAAIGHLRKAQALRAQIAQRDARNKLAQVEARAALEAAKKDAEIHKLRFVELHAMQSKLVEAEKMALLGTLAAGAAHELNTPLGVLRSNTHLATTATGRLQALVAEGAVGGDAIAKLASVLGSCATSTELALQRIEAVVQSLARFTQLDQAEVRRFDVREGLESAIAVLAPTVSGEVTFERRFAVVPEIEAWPRELNQAFLTVLRNAAEAIDGAGVVTVETRATPEHVLVLVRDTGRGMSADKAAHLFDMAWSAEGERTKMRMGLYAAYASAQKLGGVMEVESAPGRGTTVTFRLPIARR